MTARARAVAGAIALPAALAGCAIGYSEVSEVPSPDAASAADGSLETTVRVFAAASLSEVLEEIALSFEQANPGVDVVGNYAGSSDLATQINEGAYADVFLSANEEQMDAIGDNAAGEPVLFASNHLTIAVPEGNPAGITDLADFADPDQVTVICAPEVPCGDAALTLAEAEGLTLTPSSEEANVTDVLGKVAAGQADGGLVYLTDIARAEGVEEIEVPEAADVRNLYPAAALTGAADPELAAAFVDFLMGADAQELLAQAGFDAP